MAEFITGTQLDEKLTDIIWHAKKELIIFSPFIILDEHCKKIFNKLSSNPELEIIIVFGKNEREVHRSLKKEDLDFFMHFINITIIYCKNLHAKYYANEKEALLTSLNLLGKSMTENVEYGVSFLKNDRSNDDLYIDSINYSKEVIAENPCIFVQRPYYGAIGSKNDVDIVRLLDETESLYNNRRFPFKYYNEFESKVYNNDNKPSRNNNQKNYHKSNAYATHYDDDDDDNSGYCIRTGIKIPFNPAKPYSYDAYQTWVIYENPYYRENYCHRTGRESNGRTSMTNPILY
jgi:hypothetical protein